MLAYNQSGDAGEAVVLLHGLFGNARNLATLAGHLAQHYKVYSIDLPNHGDSPHVDGMSIPMMADQVHHTLQELGIKGCYLLGHSLGGKAAMSLALRYPAQVRKIVVADIAPVTYPAYHSEIIAALQAIDLQALRSRSQADAELSASITDLGTRQFLLQNLRKQGDHYRWKMNLPVIASNYPALRAEVSLDDGGQPFSGPALFVAGEKSDYICAEYEPAIESLFPHYRLFTVAGAGHWLHAEKPALFHEIVENFFLNE